MIALQTKRHNPVTYHRLRPFTKLDTNYYWVKDGIYEGTTHLITNNAFFPHFLEEINKLKKKMGFKLVMDVDDYWLVDRWNPVYKELQGATLQSRIDTMKAADILTTTHTRLAAELQILNPTAEIIIIPNALDSADPQWKPQPVKDVSFGYIGGPTHKRDLEELKGVQRRIDILAPDYFRAKLYAKQTFPYTTQSEYGNLYNRFSVSLAPIYQTKFSSLKSDIKAVEAGLKHRMLIASKCHPYLDNDAIMLADTYTEWNNLKNLSKEQVLEYAGRLHEWAWENRQLQDVNKIRQQLIDS